ncbi:MAG TPA: DUF4159 domain-containing protein [Bacteroidetes bacterium]|nr:hypothetical protein BMS3Bbin04_00600 [bacterium BMS3Bbin04]HDO65043.1 DUF4159 domain-containing protein [Bacteroidota bacterium]HEX04168.1 DUF4159 domain-containing protein [Bacteroidota bacterium]
MVFHRIFTVAILATFVSISMVAAEPFSIARVHYDGGGDWYGDPSSLVNLQNYLTETIGIETTEKETTVRIMDEALFRHPYLYLTGHGNIHFSNEEASRLREYLLGGGFLHVDDNYGLDESFRREIRKVFPERELTELPFDHPIYHSVFNFNDGLPKIHKHDGYPAQGFAILYEGRVVMFYSYQCDLGDGWEDADVHNVPAIKREAALQMGVNLIVYALSGQPEELP